MYLSEAKASHSHKMWTEVSSSVPHFLHLGSFPIPIMHRCLLKVLCPVSRPITTLVWVLLRDNSQTPVAGSGPDINSQACLCVLQVPSLNAECCLPIQQFNILPHGYCPYSSMFKTSFEHNFKKQSSFKRTWTISLMKQQFVVTHWYSFTGDKNWTNPQQTKHLSVLSFYENIMTSSLFVGTTFWMNVCL